MNKIRFVTAVLVAAVVLLASAGVAGATDGWADGLADCEKAWLASYGASHGGVVREVRGDLVHFWQDELDVTFTGQVELNVGFPGDPDWVNGGRLDHWVPATWSASKPSGCSHSEPPAGPENGPGENPVPGPCPEQEPTCRWVTLPASHNQCVIPLEGEPLSAVGAESGTHVPFYFVEASDGLHDSVIFTGPAEAVLGENVQMTMNTGEVLVVVMTPGHAYGDPAQASTTWWANGCYFESSTFHPEGFSSAPQWGEGVTPHDPVCVTEPEE